MSKANHHFTDFINKELEALVIGEAQDTPAVHNPRLVLKKTWQKALRNNFTLFLRKVFHSLHGTVPFKNAWHIPIICAKLRAAEMGLSRRLIINIPPRALKSICVSVAWPAWLMGHNPGVRIIVVSYSQALSNKHSYDCRQILATSWYQDLFPHTKVAPHYDTKAKFMTTENGFRFATSTGGTLTGEGADYIIIDDPQNPNKIMSEGERSKVYTWFQQTLSSRLNDRDKGRIIVVMQRLHEDDLSGLLLQSSRGQPAWDLLRLPLFNGSENDLFEVGATRFQRPGNTPIYSICRDIEAVAKLREEVGDYVFASQYQQDPLPIHNGIIKENWLKYEEFSKEDAGTGGVSSFDAIYQSWDCAVKNGINCDYTTCLTIGEKNGNFYILDILREKLLYSQLKERVKYQKNYFNAQLVLIEDKASGQQLLQELHGELPLIAIMPKNDKVTRLILVANFFEAGRIILPREATWLRELQKEILYFPKVAHDDQVDALTQFLLWRQQAKQQEADGDYWRMRRL